MRPRISFALAFSAWACLGACGGNVVVDRGAGSGSGAITAGSCSCSEMCGVIDACGESALCNCAAYSDAQRACLCKVTTGDCVAERACLGLHGAGGGSATTTTTTTGMTGTLTGAGGASHG